MSLVTFNFPCTGGGREAAQPVAMEERRVRGGLPGLPGLGRAGGLSTGGRLQEGNNQVT